MSFQKNLGKVKGENGATYIPNVVTENGQQYISFTSTDSSLEDIEPELIDSYVYVPSYNSNTGELSFTLTSISSLSPQSNNISIGNIKGDAGTSIIKTEVVNTLPDINNLSDEDKHTIFIVNTDDSYLDTVIYSEDKDDFVYLESTHRFGSYYTKNEIDENFYTQTQIRTQLGQIYSQQSNILSLLGNPPAINIEDDDE